MTVDSRPRPTEGRAAPPPRFARLRGLAAVLALLAAIAGVPAALLFLGSRLPLDPSVLSFDALLRPDDGRLLILVLYAVGWGAWAVFAASVSLEIVAVDPGDSRPDPAGLRFGSADGRRARGHGGPAWSGLADASRGARRGDRAPSGLGRLIG